MFQEDSEPRLRLGHPLEPIHPSLTNGPGWRLALWLQGCSLRCTARCLNPHLLGSEGGYLESSSRVAATLAATARSSPRPVEGVSLLGGEPTDQRDGLLPVLRELREAGFSVMVYTGRLLEELEGDAEFLAEIDLLVDGPFVEQEYDGALAWRGSRNQRLIRLGPRYSEADLEAAWSRQGKAYSISVGSGGRVTVSGLQTRGGGAAVERTLGKGS